VQTLLKWFMIKYNNVVVTFIISQVPTRNY
jgi:hypothetical protein